MIAFEIWTYTRGHWYHAFVPSGPPTVIYTYRISFIWSRCDYRHYNLWVVSDWSCFLICSIISSPVDMNMALYPRNQPRSHAIYSLDWWSQESLQTYCVLFVEANSHESCSVHARTCANRWREYLSSISNRIYVKPWDIVGPILHFNQT